MNAKDKNTADARYKFIVSSADEAVTVLRERLGENAKVISVRQIEGAGLARFLSAPKLEVIAKVEAPEEAGPGHGEKVAEEPMNDLGPGPGAEAEPAAEEEDAGRELPVEEKLDRILRRAGFNNVMKSRVRAEASWGRLVKMPLGGALTEVAVILRGEYMRTPRRALEESVAFIGTPGTGKTTALCKRLVTEIFIRNRKARVLKLDLERPNASEGLAVFCEAMGVPLVREGGREEEETEGTLYVDTPGIGTESRGEIAEMQKALEKRRVGSRVLVINAAYDAELIKRAYGLGERLGATHVVFTHLDELVHWGKLWEFVIGQRLQPLFLSAGENLAGDLSEQVFDSILDRTFPAIGVRSANAERVEL